MSDLTRLQNSQPVQLVDAADLLVCDITTVTPTGVENGLIVRNIPSGTQAVSGTVTSTPTGTYTVTATSMTIVPTGTQAVSGTVTSVPSGTQPVSGTVTSTPTGTYTVTATSMTIVPTGTQAVSGTVTSTPTGTYTVTATSMTIVPTGTQAVSGTVTSVPSGTQPVSGTVTSTPTGTYTVTATSMTVAQSTATNLKAQVIGAGTAGTSDTGVLTVQGINNGTPINVSQLTQTGVIVNYQTQSALASNSTATLSYTVTVGKTLYLKGVMASSSGAPCKVIVDYGVGPSVVAVGFYSASMPFLAMDFTQPPAIPASTVVNIKIQNNAGAAQDVYCTLMGEER